jgi:signal transduction histidine kinase
MVGMAARMAKELGYALLGLPLAVLGFAYLGLIVVAGGGLSLTVLGLPLLATAVLGARGWAVLQRRLARAALGVRVADPAPVHRRPGLVGWVRTGLSDAAGWRALGYLLLRVPAAVLAAAVAIACYGYGLLGATYLLWWRALPPGEPTIGGWALDTWPRACVVTAAGVVLLLLAPWAVRAALLPDRLLIRALLGPTVRDARVADLERSRAYAVDESVAALRRIERDLHDGAQARLVAVAMRLGMARENVTDGVDPETRELLDTAHRDAKAAITELRDLARGIHPPVLDEGLDPALATLAARSTVPVRLRVQVAHRPAPAVETIAYFCVAELLTNLAKHSGASHATVEVLERDGRLRVRVADDGTGGARPAAGLSGLRDRVSTVDGTLDLDSPPGGPTVVTVDLPVTP